MLDKYIKWYKQHPVIRRYKASIDMIKRSKMWRIYGLPIIILFYSVLVLVVGLFIFILMFYVSNTYLNNYTIGDKVRFPVSIFVIEKGVGAVKTSDFMSTAQWIQILISILGLLVSLFLLNQLSELKYERKRAAAEAAKKLSCEDFRTARRILNNPDVVDFFNKMQKKLQNSDFEWQKNNMSEKEFNELFNTLKDELKDIDKQNGGINILNNVELLLNEYNYIGLLIEHKVVDLDLMTDMAAKNAQTVFNIIRPYILFRRISPNHKEYASNYVNWMCDICGLSLSVTNDIKL